MLIVRSSMIPPGAGQMKSSPFWRYSVLTNLESGSFTQPSESVDPIGSLFSRMASTASISCAPKQAMNETYSLLSPWTTMCTIRSGETLARPTIRDRTVSVWRISKPRPARAMASAARLAFLWRFSAYAIDPMRMADFATVASVMPVCATPLALTAAAAANVAPSHPPRQHEGRERSLVQPPFPRTDRIRTNHHDSGLAALNLDEPDVAALG